ncbi:MAG: aldehyde dehydrogenase family protein [Phycisphaera sp.]|nr:MAG: aldehyde dehydrogenase family protein [Phycisphaera sp.]
MPDIKDVYPLYLAGKPEIPNTDLEVRDIYTGGVASCVPLASAEMIDAAIAACAAAADECASIPAYQRKAVLRHCVDRFKERSSELARVLCVEAGKPIRDSEGEVTRLIDTFEIAAEESTRLNGEVIEMQITQRADGYRGMTKRVPVGVCSFITPFNFPLNLVAHKVAPAIACGCPFVLKPSDKTPIGALIIGEILAETDLPPGAFSVLPSRVEDAGALVTDERIRYLSFTGSDRVGKELITRAGLKRVTLELGGNAACVIDESGDVETAIERIVFGGYYQSGQSCVSVQRVLAHSSVYDRLRDGLVAEVSGLKSGNPGDRDTFIGPMIDEQSAKRIESWINEAVAGGARLLAGGRRAGSMLEATLLEDVPVGMTINQEEVFGPVVLLSRFDEFDRSIEIVNESRFGLQAGVFTDSVTNMHKAWDQLRVGGVVINDVPSFRVDHMPYGGVKDSGLGREGVRSAIEEMTEVRLMVVRDKR